MSHPFDSICRLYLGRPYAEASPWWIGQIASVLQPLDVELLRLHVELNDHYLDTGRWEQP